MRCLVYRRGGLGDTLLTFPLIEVLHRKGYKVVAVGNTDYFRIAEAVGWAERVLTDIPDEEFDLEVVISFDGNVKPFPDRRVWVVHHYLRSLGFEGERFSERLPLDPIPGSPMSGKVVLHPSSGSPKKNPPLELFLSIERYFREAGLEVVYLVGEADLWLKDKVSQYVESLDPLWIARSLKLARMYVGLDSGISHLASYVGVPSVVIYGPTDPVVWRPVGVSVWQVSLGLECSPCFPNVCDLRPCLSPKDLLDRLLPLFDHLLVQVN